MAVEEMQTGDEPGKFHLSETCGLSSIRGVAPLNTGKDTNADCDAGFFFFFFLYLRFGVSEPVNFHSYIAVLHTCQRRKNSEVSVS
jgi:hypothetical protein